VVVVGAGFAGLSSAIALAEEGAEVVLLEADLVGSGASGRNAGHLTPTIGKDLPTLRLIYGAGRAREMVEFAELSVRYTERLIDDHAIDCDYEAVGNLLAAVHPRQHPMVERAAEAAAELGADAELLEGEELAVRGVPSFVTRALVERVGGLLNPARYVYGLRRLALERGVQLFERSPARSIAVGRGAGRRIDLRTPGGRVTADRLVVTANARTPELGLPEVPEVARLAVQLFRTAPVPGWRERWAGRQGIYTAHEILESYRLTADHRIVGGSKALRYAPLGRRLPDVDRGAAEHIERAFRQRFDGLEVEVTDRWGGLIAIPLDFLPRVGAEGRIAYAIGWCGHGVAQASYAGRMVADLLAGRSNPAAVLWERRSMPMPPEPLRSLIAHGLLAGFGWWDARTDGLNRRA
jgi:glycine/D-amino acid oxidase-like deaminating enzyme